MSWFKTSKNKTQKQAQEKYIQQPDHSLDVNDPPQGGSGLMPAIWPENLAKNIKWPRK